MGARPLSPAWSTEGMRWPPKPDERKPPRLGFVGLMHRYHRTSPDEAEFETGKNVTFFSVHVWIF